MREIRPVPGVVARAPDPQKRINSLSGSFVEFMKHLLGAIAVGAVFCFLLWYSFEFLLKAGGRGAALGMDGVDAVVLEPERRHDAPRLRSYNNPPTVAPATSAK